METKKSGVICGSYWQLLNKKHPIKLPGYRYKTSKIKLDVLKSEKIVGLN